jgi:hypothetical protein
MTQRKGRVTHVVMSAGTVVFEGSYFECQTKQTELLNLNQGSVIVTIEEAYPGSDLLKGRKRDE